MSSEVRCHYEIKSGSLCAKQPYKNFDFCHQHLISMTRENTHKDVIRILAEHLGKRHEDILDTSRIIGDLDADSLDTVELVMACEEAFQIEVADSIAEKMTTVSDMVEHVVELRLKNESYSTKQIAIPDLDDFVSTIGAKPRNVGKQIATILRSELFSEYLQHFRLHPPSVLQLLTNQIGTLWIEHVTTVPKYKDDGTLLSAHIVILTQSHIYFYHLQDRSITGFIDKLEETHIIAKYRYDERGNISQVTTLAKSPNVLSEFRELRFTFGEKHGVDRAIEFLNKYIHYREKHADAKKN